MSNPWGVSADGAGNLYIADRSNHGVRRVTDADSKIASIIGSGTSGFAGDGSAGRGVTLTAEVTSGPTTLPAEEGVRVDESNWDIFSVSSTQDGPTFTFKVRQAAAGIVGGRMGQSTTFSLLSTSTVVFTLPADLTITNNSTQVTGTATTAGAGQSEIVAQSSATGIVQGSSSSITVEPVITSVSPGTGAQTVTTEVVLNGRNLITATGITAPSGITATITGGTTTALTANVQVGSGVSLGNHTLTLVTPGGNVDFTFNVTAPPLDLTISEAYPTKTSP